ncbi:MAG TPA: right-handed parallel beta-helix repeat-containing protein [Verrucomicrobiae bacterium]
MFTRWLSPALLGLVFIVFTDHLQGAENVAGVRGKVGCKESPRKVERLVIDKPGVYENILVDGKWAAANLVKITADNVTLRNCEILNGRHNGITVYATNVVIESCKIHHLLNGTFKDQQDAHGITGRPQNLVIRNCEIYYTSGDSVQFDPGRGPWDNVLIENCTFWNGPLPEDAAGFKKGERPGENALDTKQSVKNPRSRITVSHCVFYGWNQPGQIENLAALNLKNHVEVKVERCLFRDNEICLRLRGGTGDYGGALVSISDCAVYDSAVAVRIEDKIADLKISRLGMGTGIKTKVVNAGGGAGAGFVNEGEYVPVGFEEMVRKWNL